MAENDRKQSGTARTIANSVGLDDAKQRNRERLAALLAEARAAESVASR